MGVPVNQNGGTLIFHQSVNRCIDHIADCLCSVACVSRDVAGVPEQLLSFDQWFIQERIDPQVVS